MNLNATILHLSWVYLVPLIPRFELSLMQFLLFQPILSICPLQNWEDFGIFFSPNLNSTKFFNTLGKNFHILDITIFGQILHSSIKIIKILVLTNRIFLKIQYFPSSEFCSLEFYFF